MDKRKFLISFILVVIIGLCWTVGQVAAQENTSMKRDAAWGAADQIATERAKTDPSFKRYLDIYNARMEALSKGDQTGNQKSKGTKKGEGK